MIPHTLLTQLKLLPLKKGPVRFAVGSPDGLTSNAWRLWVSKAGDVYIACRDNFREAKVSLHPSGRWRMGLTTEAIRKNTNLLPCDQNRAWEVWDEPPTVLPETVIAFRLIFPTSELAVRPEQRLLKTWDNVIYIEAAPPGRLTILTLFITTRDVVLRHASEPSFCLASLDIGEGRQAQLVAHGDPEREWSTLIAKSVAVARIETERNGIEIPSEAYAYFFGRGQDGSRFLVGARMSN